MNKLTYIAALLLALPVWADCPVDGWQSQGVSGIEDLRACACDIPTGACACVGDAVDTNTSAYYRTVGNDLTTWEQGNNGLLGGDYRGAINSEYGIMVAGSDGYIIDIRMTQNLGVQNQNRPSTLNDWYDLAWNGKNFEPLSENIYVAVGRRGSAGVIGRRTFNTISWTQQIIVGSDRFVGVAYGADKFVAIEVDGTVRISTDGDVWTILPSLTGQFQFLDFVGDVFIAGGEGGELWASLDGIAWSEPTISSGATWLSAGYQDGKYHIGGQFASATTDDPFGTWSVTGGLGIMEDFATTPAGAVQAGPDGYNVFVCLSTDTDGDGVSDATDNCTEIANPDQRDTNGDGYGNICDPDLNNDGTVNFPDLDMLGDVFFTDDDDADFNGDGIVNFLDLDVMEDFFFSAPGPSAQ